MTPIQKIKILKKLGLELQKINDKYEAFHLKGTFEEIEDRLNAFFFDVNNQSDLDLLSSDNKLHEQFIYALDRFARNNPKSFASIFPSLCKLLEKSSWDEENVLIPIVSKPIEQLQELPAIPLVEEKPLEINIESLPKEETKPPMIYHQMKPMPLAEDRRIAIVNAIEKVKGMTPKAAKKTEEVKEILVDNPQSEESQPSTIVEKQQVNRGNDIEETWVANPISRSSATYTIVLKQYQNIDFNIRDLLDFLKSQSLIIQDFNVKVE